MNHANFSRKLALAAILPAALFAMSASAAGNTYVCQPKGALQPGLNGQYETKVLTAADRVHPTGLRIDGQTVTFLEMGPNGEILHEAATKAGNPSSCGDVNKTDVQLNVPEFSFSPDVLTLPAAAFAGEKQFEMSEVIDEDADGLACHGFVWSCVQN
jgi:hypothetical protein